jgi:hypothetical protein
MGTFDVDVNPLRVIGRCGEGIDSLLGNRHPVTDVDLLTHP